MIMNLRNIASVIAFAIIPSLVFGQEATSSAPKNVSIGDGIELHYIEQGEGTPVIFIHGLTDDYTVWTSQLQHFAKKGYRAIAYSRRYNYPNNNELRPNHSASVEANDLAAFIHKLRLPKAHILGHSYGGYAALILSLDHPDLVRTLTLAEPPIVPWLVDLPKEYSAAGKAHFESLMTEGIHPAKAAFESGKDKVALKTIIDCIAGKPTFEKLPEFVKTRCWRNINDVKAVMTSDHRYPDVDRDQVRHLLCPTLILSGSKSRSAARLTDKELERLLPKRSQQRIVLQGATHLMWLEQPEQCREAVLKFIHGK